MSFFHFFDFYAFDSVRLFAVRLTSSSSHFRCCCFYWFLVCFAGAKWERKKEKNWVLDDDKALLHYELWTLLDFSLFFKRSLLARSAMPRLDSFLNLLIDFQFNKNHKERWENGIVGKNKKNSRIGKFPNGDESRIRHKKATFFLWIHFIFGSAFLGGRWEI